MANPTLTTGSPGLMTGTPTRRTRMNLATRVMDCAPGVWNENGCAHSVIPSSETSTRSVPWNVPPTCTVLKVPAFALTSIAAPAPLPIGTGSDAKSQVAATAPT